MIYLLSWYVQDFLWILSSGKVLVPEIYLLALVFLSMFRTEDGVRTVWAAFIGGVLWDLRWTGLPGATSLLYVTTLMLVRWLWRSIPATGRTISLFGLLLWFSNMPITLARLFLWGARGLSILAGLPGAAEPHSPAGAPRVRGIRMEVEKPGCLTFAP